MEITRGKIVSRGLKFVVYGPEGIGKSTFVSKIPGIVFIDTEGSTGQLDVARYPAPTSWQMLLQEVQDFAAHPGDFQSLVIDTADWAERLCTEHVLATRQLQSVEDPGYGRGYVYVAEEFGRLLDLLSVCAKQGQNVGFTAHAMMRKFEQPDELGAYDRWELKLSKKDAPLVKEWSDLLLFANYKTLVYQADQTGKKHKASGGQRVMYTTHHPCWDAKNRAGLPEELAFSFDSVAHLFSSVVYPQTAPVRQDLVASQSVQQKQPDLPAGPPPVELPEEAPPLAEPPAPARRVEVTQTDSVPPAPDYAGIPDALRDLMAPDHVTPLEIRTAVSQKGYFPLETPFTAYPLDFIQGVLIGAWPQVRSLILANREEMPF